MTKQRGTHSWPIIHDYHRCPSCGRIMESREDFEYRFGQYQKDLECPYCHKRFTATKRHRVSIGPLITPTL